MYQPNKIVKPGAFVGYELKAIKYDPNGSKIVLSLPDINGAVIFNIKSRKNICTRQGQRTSFPCNN